MYTMARIDKAVWHKTLIGFFIFCAYTATVFANQGAYDVSSFSLNGLSVQTHAGRETLTFEVAARRSSGFETSLNIQKATEKAIEYFFIGLTVPDEAFWVNLNPKGMTQIMEPGLADTDLGKVMLAADLRLKKDTCDITNPQKSKIGRDYWDRLYAKADELGIVDQIPVYNRVWIMPAQARLIQTQGRIEIAQSALEVCFEADVFAGNTPAGGAKAKQLQEYAGALMRDMIIPELNKRVNESRSYSDLRQVYNALILARAYKQKAVLNGDTWLNGLDAKAVLADVEKSIPLDKDKIYADYLRSLRQGEYNFKEDVSGRLNFYMEVITRQYMSGGIDWRRIDIEDVGAQDSGARGSARTAMIDHSFTVSFAHGAARPLAAVKEQLAKRFSAYNEARAQQTALSVDNLPAPGPSEGSGTMPYIRNMEIMLRHL
ncbi:MAG: hypothetical protein KBC23_02765 [Candidatus Omnitrophica bacterium]|nr:hypothetical protein [Candidatus Omnitrophota bacterium]